MKDQYYGCEVEFVENKLSRNTKERQIQKLKELSEYEDAHNGFDIIDPFGNVADVYLFQKNGQMFVRGRAHYLFRNPENVYEFLKRSRKVKRIKIVVNPEGQKEI